MTQDFFKTELPLINLQINSSTFLKEITIGVVFGTIISILFEIFPFVGRMIDTFRGNQFSEQIAPELGVRDSVLEVYASLAMPAIFFNGPYYLKFIELYSRYSVTSLSLHSKKENLESMLSNSNFIYFLTNGILEISVKLIFPLVLIAISLELSLAVFQKLYSRFQVGVELGLIRTGFGIIFLFLILKFDQPLTYLDKFLIDLVNFK